MRTARPVLLLCCTALVSLVASAAEINFDHVRDLAAKRAAEPYRAPSEELPPRLAALNYDETRAIEFRADRAVWRKEGLPFQIQFFPRGGLFKHEVVMHEVARGRARPLAYDPADFQVTGIADLPALPGGLGYAGLKILHPLNRPDAFDEVISFLGASYFRAIGSGQIYGLSARGLALDAAVDGRKEEFPLFTQFWISKPAPKAKSVTVHALLEGPSVAGAYEFVVTPGRTTWVDVRATLHFRTTDKLPGFAPLTSMYWYGENGGRPEGDPRPEVHDSDGLFVRDRRGGEAWWPLQNPRTIDPVEIPVPELAWFGLGQRDRRAENYADPKIQYERRPTAWVEPQKDWEPGKVRLAQLPATQEYADNMVAYWVPDRRPQPGVPVELNYRLAWSLEEPGERTLARVVATRASRSESRRATLSLDFADPNAGKRKAAELAVEAKAGGEVRILQGKVEPSPEAGGWRATFEVEAGSAGSPVTLECRLRDARDPISETWSYRWRP